MVPSWFTGRVPGPLAVTSRLAVMLGLIAGSIVALGMPAQAYTNFSAPLTGGTDVATGFPVCGLVGPVGIIQDGTNLFVTGNCNRTLYRFPAGGGSVPGAMAAHNLLNLDLTLAHGVYYATTDALNPRGVYSFDPATLAVGHLIAPFPQTAYGIVGDPLSNDLYVDTPNGIWRIQNPDSSPVVTHVVTSNLFDGIQISADGQHIWAANRNLDSVQEFGRPGSNGL